MKLYDLLGTERCGLKKSDFYGLVNPQIREKLIKAGLEGQLRYYTSL